MPPIPMAAAFAVVSLAAKRQIANIALKMAVAGARKVLTAAIKQGGPIVQQRVTDVVVRLEEAATRYEELAVAEPAGKKHLWFRFVAEDAKAAAAIFRELSHLIEQHADGKDVEPLMAKAEPLIAKAEEKLQELASRQQQSATTE